MSVDSSTMVIITAVGTAGATAGGILWRALVRLNRSTITALDLQNRKLEKRTEECEEDRKLLHGRLNEQGERINKMSKRIGQLEGQIHNTKT